ncbi:MAG: DMT family transporter [Pseudomonadota bacterium]
MADRPQTADLRRAIALVLLANLLFAMVDSSTKWLIAAGMGVLQLAFLRYAVHCAITLAETASRGLPAVPRRDQALVLLRAFCLVSSTVANFVALGHLPLAVTSSILFLSPVLTVLFARAMLGEALTAARIGAVIVGFTGVVVIVNPFAGAINYYALLMLYPATALALYIVLTRMLGTRVSAHRMQLTIGVMGTVALAPLAVWYWAAPQDPLVWALACAIGAFAWAGHEVLTRAHQSAEASTLAPFGYSFVLYLVVVGWLVFGETPSLATLAGGSLIICAGLLVLGQQGRIRS